jgi:hypothetical protein
MLEHPMVTQINRTGYPKFKEVRKIEKEIEDHPIEDVYGLEIYPGDMYWIFGNDVVNDLNLKTYLIENQQISCFRAQG